MEQEKIAKAEKIPAAEKTEGISRREFLKTAGFLSALIAGKPEEAAALLEKAVEPKEADKEKVKVVFRFFNAIHKTGKDVENLPEEIQKADIYIPEAVGWNNETVADYKALARGEIAPKELLEKYGAYPEDTTDNWRSKEFEALSNSQKIVLFADLPVGHPLYEKYREGRITPTREIKTFADVLAQVKNSLKNFAEAIAIREKHIVSEIITIKENIENGQYPELKGKRAVNVLIFLGAIHTPVYHKIKEIDENASRRFSTMPFNYSNYGAEIVRRYMFGKEVSDELAAKAFLSGYIDSLPRWAKLNDTHKAHQYTRAVVEQFSHKDIEAFFNDLQNTDFFTERVVLKHLRTKNIKIPSSDAELDELLKKKKH
ncbi:MAG: hypothetical protein HYW90_03390 [Candidatus Sungbacteria bacterium]|nr:hypothetical protein [Candidatus Sungbacteria bacterium]